MTTSNDKSGAGEQGSGTKSQQGFDRDSDAGRQNQPTPANNLKATTAATGHFDDFELNADDLGLDLLLDDDLFDEPAQPEAQTQPAAADDLNLDDDLDDLLDDIDLGGVGDDPEPATAPPPAPRAPAAPIATAAPALDDEFDDLLMDIDLDDLGSGDEEAAVSSAPPAAAAPATPAPSAAPGLDDEFDDLLMDIDFNLEAEHPAAEAEASSAPPAPPASSAPKKAFAAPAMDDDFDDLIDSAELALPDESGKEPVAEEPVAEEPVIEEPVIEEPVIEEPIIEEPIIEEPIIEEPIIEEPVTKELSAEEPAPEELAVKEPLPDTRTAKELTAQELTVEAPEPELAPEPAATKAPAAQAAATKPPPPKAKKRPAVEVTKPKPKTPASLAPKEIVSASGGRAAAATEGADGRRVQLEAPLVDTPELPADHQAYRQGAQTLARSGRWEAMAAWTLKTVNSAGWVTDANALPLLQDLARLYADRLRDTESAQRVLEAVLALEPAHDEALGQLESILEDKGAFAEQYDALLRAVQAGWDPEEQQAHTERAADIALNKLQDSGLAAQAWDQLWRLDDSSGVAARQLSDLYRQTKSWSELSSFLLQRAEREPEGEASLARREAASLTQYVLADAPAALELLQQNQIDNELDDAAAWDQLEAWAASERYDSLRDAGLTAADGGPSSAWRLERAFHLLWESDQYELAAPLLDALKGASPDKTEYQTFSLELARSRADLGALADELSASIKAGASAAAIRELAETLETLGRPEEALERWLELTQGEPEHEQALQRISALATELGRQELSRDTADKLADMANTLSGRREAAAAAARAAATIDGDASAEGRWWSLLEQLPINAELTREGIEWCEGNGSLTRKRSLFQLLTRRSAEPRARAAAADKLFNLAAAEPLDAELRLEAAWARLGMEPATADQEAALSQAHRESGLTWSAALLSESLTLSERAARWLDLGEQQTAELLLEVAWRGEPAHEARDRWAELLIKRGEQHRVLAAAEADGSALSWVIEPEKRPTWWEQIDEGERGAYWRRWAAAAAIVGGSTDKADSEDATLVNLLRALSLSGDARRDELVALAEDVEGLEALGVTPMAVSLAAAFDYDTIHESALGLYARAVLTDNPLVHEAVALACTVPKVTVNALESWLELAEFYDEQAKRPAAAAAIWLGILRISPNLDRAWERLEALSGGAADGLNWVKLGGTLALYTHATTGEHEAPERAHDPAAEPAAPTKAWLADGESALFEASKNLSELSEASRELMLWEALRRAPNNGEVAAEWSARAGLSDEHRSRAITALRWRGDREGLRGLTERALELAATDPAAALQIKLELDEPAVTFEPLKAWLLSERWHGEALTLLKERIAAEPSQGLHREAAALAQGELGDFDETITQLRQLDSFDESDRAILGALDGEEATPQGRMAWLELALQHYDSAHKEALALEKATLTAAHPELGDSSPLWEALLDEYSADAGHLSALAGALDPEATAGILLSACDRLSDEASRARVFTALADLDSASLPPQLAWSVGAALDTATGQPRPPASQVAALRDASQEELTAAVKSWLDTGEPPAPAQVLLAASAGFAQPDSDKTAITGLLSRGSDDGAAKLLTHLLNTQGATPEAQLQATRAFAASVSAEQASWTLCALAEQLMPAEESQKRAMALYREARSKHPDNPCAREALRAWGRRQGALPSGDALIAGGDAPGALSLEEQTTALLGQFEASSGNDKVDYARRLAAINPAEAESWERLSHALATSGGGDEAAKYQLFALSIETARALLSGAGAASLQRRWIELGVEAMTLEKPHLLAASMDAATALDERAPALLLLRTQAAIAAGETDKAALLLSRYALPGLASADSDCQSTWAELAWLCATQGVGDKVKMLSRALELNPEHSQSARALATDPSLAERPLAERMSLTVRALSTESEREARGELYASLAKPLDEQWRREAEAAAASDLAYSYGIEEPDLLRRILRHCRSRGQSERGLELIERLLPATSDSKELTSLWLLKGQLLLATEGSEDDAIEAFDMALSYDTSLHDARLGLAEAMERLGDWQGLTDLLEGMVQVGPAEERAQSWQLISKVRADELADFDGALDAATEAWRLRPNADAAERLLALSEQTGRQPISRATLLSTLVNSGGPAWQALAEFGAASMDDSAANAWCLLSPGIVIRGTDEPIRNWLKDNRRSLDRPPLRWSHKWNASVLGSLPILSELIPLLKNQESAIVKAAGNGWFAKPDGPLGEISPHAPLGRAWGNLSSVAALDDLRLLRHEDGPASQIIYEGGDWRAYLRQDILPHLMRAELGYMLGTLSLRAQPGLRLLSALTSEGRGELLAKIYATASSGEPTPWGTDSTAALSTALAEITSAAALEQALNAELDRATASAGLLAGPDLLQVLKLQSLLHDHEDRPTAFASIELFDEWVQSHAPLRLHAAIAIAEGFADALNSSPGLT